MTTVHSIEEAKNLVIKAGIRLVETGLIARTWGNVSQRISEDRFVITPSGRDYRSLTPDDIVIVHIKDCRYSGKIKPSSEKGIHAEVYKKFPEANFVIHTHQEYASVISACGLDQIKIDQEPPFLAGEVICATYALPSTKKLQRNVAVALSHSKNKAVIMKNHGALTFGIDDEDAFMVALELEKACKNYVAAEYKKRSGEDLVDPAKLSRFALALGTSASSNTTGHITKKYFSSRRTEDGFLLYDSNTEIKVHKNEHNASLPEEAQIYQAIYDKHAHIHFISWNCSPEILEFSHSNHTLKPLLDDFAQIVGTSVKIVENTPAEITAALKRSSAVFIRNRGALCCGSTNEDAIATGMVLEKNCKAYIGANLFGHVKPIHYFESLLMRFMYTQKYSKQALHNTY